MVKSDKKELHFGVGMHGERRLRDPNPIVGAGSWRGQLTSSSHEHQASAISCGQLYMHR